MLVCDVIMTGRMVPLPQQEDQAPKLPINESVKRLYPQRNNVSNIYFFRLQQMTSKLKSVKDAVPNAPFDFCVTRKKERRSYKDPKTGQLCTAVHETDTHYHLRVACVQAAELSFVPCSLAIPEGRPLTECHKSYITKEFSPRVY